MGTRIKQRDKNLAEILHNAGKKHWEIARQLDTGHELDKAMLQVIVDECLQVIIEVKKYEKAKYDIKFSKGQRG